MLRPCNSVRMYYIYIYIYISIMVIIFIKGAVIMTFAVRLMERSNVVLLLNCGGFGKQRSHDHYVHVAIG